MSTGVDTGNSPDFESDEERRTALAVFQQTTGTYDLSATDEHAAVKRREPVIAFVQRDPELFAGMMQGYDFLSTSIAGLTNEQLGVATTDPRGVRAVSDDPEIIHKYKTATLFVAAVAWNMKGRQKFGLRLMATMPDMYSAGKWIMLGHPESEVWDDEERLVLQFTHGILNGKLSDALFERAREMWGLKGTLRRTSWIGEYVRAYLLTELNISDAARLGALDD